MSDCIPPALDLLISDMLVDSRAIGIEAIYMVRQSTEPAGPGDPMYGRGKPYRSTSEQSTNLALTVIHKPFSLDRLIDAVNIALAFPNHRHLYRTFQDALFARPRMRSTNNLSSAVNAPQNHNTTP